MRFVCRQGLVLNGSKQLKFRRVCNVRSPKCRAEGKISGSCQHVISWIGPGDVKSYNFEG
jgi:hypothetical protein